MTVLLAVAPISTFGRGAEPHGLAVQAHAPEGWDAGELTPRQREELESVGFTSTAQGTVVTRDGLEWAGRDSGEALNWYDAMAYCESLSLAGESDWRLPEVGELEALSQVVANEPKTATECSFGRVDWRVHYCRVLGIEEFCNQRSRRVPGIEMTCHLYWTRTVDTSADYWAQPGRPLTAAMVSFSKPHGGNIDNVGRRDLANALCLRVARLPEASLDMLSAQLSSHPAANSTSVPPSPLAELLAFTTGASRAREIASSFVGRSVPGDLTSQLRAAVEWPVRPHRGIQQYDWFEPDCGYPALGQGDVLPARDPPPRCLNPHSLRFSPLSVVVRIPRDYDPRTPWPLLVVVNRGPQVVLKGGEAFEAQALEDIAAAERQLGPAIEEWVVVAPVGDSWLGGNRRDRSFLRALRKTFHLDAGRTVALGWGTPGGFNAWNWALYHGDDLAAAIAIDQSFPPPTDGPLWQEIASQALAVPVLSVWGSKDRRVETTGIVGSARQSSRDLVPELTPVRYNFGSVRQRNRDLQRRLAAEPRYSRWGWIEVAGRASGDPSPIDSTVFRAWLARRREPSPDEFGRYLALPGERAGSAWWLQALSIIESGWDPWQAISRQRGESLDEAFLHGFQSGTAHLVGRRTIEGDVLRITVQAHLVDGLAVHFECDRLSTPQMVVLEVDGAQVFRGVVTPSLPIALLEARRTLDFDRLTCAILARSTATEPWGVVSP